MKRLYGLGFVVYSLVGLLRSIGFLLSRSLAYGVELFGRLFVKDLPVIKARPLLKVFVDVALYQVKPDKERAFFRFLRVQNSWIAL